ncbi:MAG: preprotein translocase subunit YajC [Clostridia bacterium]|nr:MAG: preprotein translocase subunit YajC [Clostridia bacterium]
MNAWGGSIFYVVIFFAIIYFLMIRPQQTQQKKRQQMLGSLKVNDHIITVGGIHGRITRMKEDRITVRIADKVEVEMEKTAVASVAGQEE